MDGEPIALYVGSSLSFRQRVSLCLDVIQAGKSLTSFKLVLLSVAVCAFCASLYTYVLRVSFGGWVYQHLFIIRVGMLLLTTTTIVKYCFVQADKASVVFLVGFYLFFGLCLLFGGGSVGIALAGAIIPYSLYMSWLLFFDVFTKKVYHKYDENANPIEYHCKNCYDDEEIRRLELGIKAISENAENSVTACVTNSGNEVCPSFTQGMSVDINDVRSLDSSVSEQNRKVTLRSFTTANKGSKRVQNCCSSKNPRKHRVLKVILYYKPKQYTKG